MSKNGSSGCSCKGLAVVLFLLYSAAGFGAPPAKAIHGDAAPQASGMDHDHGAMPMDMDHDHEAMKKGDADHEHAHAGHAHGAMTPAAPVVWSLLLASLAIAGGLIWSARRALLRSPQVESMARANVLDLPVIGKILRSRRFLAFLIAPTMVVFLLIVLVGLRGEQDTGNPAILLTWILWWPAVIFTFFLAGRVLVLVLPFWLPGASRAEDLLFAPQSSRHVEEHVVAPGSLSGADVGDDSMRAGSLAAGHGMAGLGIDPRGHHAGRGV